MSLSNGEPNQQRPPTKRRLVGANEHLPERPKPTFLAVPPDYYEMSEAEQDAALDEMVDQLVAEQGLEVGED